MAFSAADIVQDLNLERDTFVMIGESAILINSSVASISFTEALCTQNPKFRTSVVLFHVNEARTGLTLAGGLGHVIGMQHNPQ